MSKMTDRFRGRTPPGILALGLQVHTDAHFTGEEERRKAVIALPAARVSPLRQEKWVLKRPSVRA